MQLSLEEVKMIMDGMRAAMLMAGGVAPGWYVPIKITLIVLISIIALFIILVVLLQPGNEEGLGAITGSTTDTYLGKNKGKSWEGRLKKLTIIAAILLVIFCIVFAVIEVVAQSF